MNNAGTTSREANGVTERAKSVASDFQDTMSSAGKIASDTAHKAVQSLAETGKNAQEVFEKYKDEGEKQLESLEKYVRSNPLKSVLISAAAGMVLSRFMKH